MTRRFDLNQRPTKSSNWSWRFAVVKTLSEPTFWAFVAYFWQVFTSKVNQNTCLVGVHYLFLLLGYLVLPEELHNHKPSI